MNSTKTILHVGIGKAGSSSIQNFFSERRDELLKQNIFYPYDVVQGNKLGGDNHKCLAMICINYSRGNIVFKQQRVCSQKEKNDFDQRVLERYAEQLKNIPHDVRCILSAEHFWSVLTTEESIICLRKNLERLNLKVERIIIYIREQVQWLESFTQQKLIEGSAISLEIPFKDDSTIRARLDYFETIKLWESCFPEATIVPRVFEKKMFKGGSLVYDFLYVSGQEYIAKNYPDYELEKLYNAADLTVEGYLLLALFNNHEKNLKKQCFNKHGTYSSSRKALMEYLRNKFSGKPSHFFTQDLVLSIRNMFKDSNERVREKYFSSHLTLFENTDIENLGTYSMPHRLSSDKLVEYLYDLVIS